MFDFTLILSFLGFALMVGAFFFLKKELANRKTQRRIKETQQYRTYCVNNVPWDLKDHLPPSQAWAGVQDHRRYMTEGVGEAVHFDREETAKLSEANWATVCLAFWQVMDTFTWRQDPEPGNWFRSDPDGPFDCQSFAVQFKLAIIDRDPDFPKGALRVATVPGHAVLCVFFDKGVVTLDNTKDHPVFWQPTSPVGPWAVETVNGKWTHQIPS